MNWRERRQLLYIGVAVIVLGFGLFYAGYSYLTTPGSCHDNVQNDSERGIDCGGPCARLCSTDTRDPIVVWARALPVATGTYTGAAYIQNPQASLGGAAYGVGYLLRLFDADNHLVIEQAGTMDLPPIEHIPLIVPNIPTGSKSAAHAQLSFTTSPIVWVTIPPADRPKLSIKNVDHPADWSRVSAAITNELNTPVEHLSVAAVLYDAENNAVAASESVIKEIPAAGSDDVVFTWPGPNSTAVRAEIVPIPALPPQARR